MTILDGFIQLLTMAYDGSLSSQIFSKGILVCGWATPLKNMSSSVGMIIPNIWKKNPNHQPDIIRNDLYSLYSYQKKFGSQTSELRTNVPGKQSNRSFRSQAMDFL
jgi:hypothetical protein